MHGLAAILERAESVDAGVMDDPIVLMNFLRGMEFGDARWTEPLGAISAELASEFGCNASIDAGALCVLFCESRAAGVRKMVSAIGSHLDEYRPDPEAREDWRVAKFVDILPEFPARAPMYIGGWSAAQAYVFFEGYAIASESSGVSVAAERNALAQMERMIRQRTGLPGRWDRILDVVYGGERRCMEQLWRDFQEANPSGVPC